MQYRVKHSQDLAIVHVHCAPGTAALCHLSKCSFRWMDPCRDCDWMSPRTGQDYKLFDKARGGGSDKPIGSLRRGTERSSWISEVHFAYQWCCVSWGGSQAPVWESGSLLAFANPQLSMCVIDCDKRASGIVITLEGRSGYLLFRSHGALQLVQYQHVCLLVFPLKTLQKGLLQALTGAPGAPGGPKIAPPLCEHSFYVIT